MKNKRLRPEMRADDGVGAVRNKPLRTYGRRKGHSLSPRQQQLIDDLLPKIAVRPRGDETGLDLHALFAQSMREYWLEIGFGGGEHLALQGEYNPDIGLIGCEPYLNGVVSLLNRIENGDLTNIRIHDGDSRDIILALPAAILDRVFILFPDPWPKRRHHKRRLVSTETLDLLARVMRPGAELRVATDIGDYMRTTLLAVIRHPEFEWPARSAAAWREREQPGQVAWPQTRYEAKAVRAGRRCAYFRFQRRGMPG